MPVRLMLDVITVCAALVQPPFGLVMVWADIRDQKYLYQT